MRPKCIQIILEERESISAKVQSLRMVMYHGPSEDLPCYSEVTGAMLSYIDEFSERLHHSKKMEYLFLLGAKCAPEKVWFIARLDEDHAGSIIGCWTTRAERMRLSLALIHLKARLASTPRSSATAATDRPDCSISSRLLRLKAALCRRFMPTIRGEFDSSMVRSLAS